MRQVIFKITLSLLIIMSLFVVALTVTRCVRGEVYTRLIEVQEGVIASISDNENNDIEITAEDIRQMNKDQLVGLVLVMQLTELLYRYDSEFIKELNDRILTVFDLDKYGESDK